VKKKKGERREKEKKTGGRDLLSMYVFEQLSSPSLRGATTKGSLCLFSLLLQVRSEYELAN